MQNHSNFCVRVYIAMKWLIDWNNLRYLLVLNSSSRSIIRQHLSSENGDRELWRIHRIIDCMKTHISTEDFRSGYKIENLTLARRIMTLTHNNLDLDLDSLRPWYKSLRPWPKNDTALLIFTLIETSRFRDTDPRTILTDEFGLAVCELHKTTCEVYIFYGGLDAETNIV